MRARVGLWTTLWKELWTSGESRGWPVGNPEILVDEPLATGGGRASYGRMTSGYGVHRFFHRLWTKHFRTGSQRSAG
jgi:hypothetical protein